MSSVYYQLDSRKQRVLPASLVLFDLINGRSLSRSSENRSIVVVVISLLTGLIKDHVDLLKKRGIDVGYLDSDSTSDMKNSVSIGKLSLVLMSPEKLLGKWRCLFVSKDCQKCLVGLVVHCR